MDAPNFTIEETQTLFDDEMCDVNCERQQVKSQTKNFEVNPNFLYTERKYIAF